MKMTVRSMLCMALLLAAAAASAQSDLLYGDEVEVSVVNVDVSVTDSDGLPVYGLERDDFVLLEDGEPVVLSNFLAVENPVRPSPAVDSVSEGVEARTAAVQIEPGSQRAQFVLYFDNSTLVQAHRNRILDELHGFVDSMDGRARFLVVTFDPGLTLVSSFTDDVSVVHEALDRVGAMPASGLDSIRNRTSARDFMRAIWKNWEDSKGWGGNAGERGSGRRYRDSASALGTQGRFFDPCVEAWPEMINAIEGYAQQEVHRVQAAQAGLLAMTRALVGVQGRKHVLYMSDGLELVPALAEYEMMGELCPDRERELFGMYSRFEQSGAFEELTAFANTHRVTFYALDTAGLSGASLASADLDDRRFAPSMRNDTTRRENLRGSMFAMADGTGGLAFFNANQPAPELERMALDASNYYSLGFNPENGWDGDVHKLKLHLAEGVGRGYELRYRRRYRALPETEKVAERTLSVLVLGAEENPLGVSVTADQPSEISRGRRVVPLSISLPIEKLTLIPDRGVERGEVRVVVAVADPTDHKNALYQQVIPVEIRKRDRGMESHVVTIRLRFEPGEHTIGLGVEDRLGKTASYLQTLIDVESGDELSGRVEPAASSPAVSGAL
jgi:VWFA-related protein